MPLLTVRKALSQVTRLYVTKTVEAWATFAQDTLENIGFIFGSLNPAEWLLRLLVINVNALEKTAQELAQIPFEIAAEFALQANDALPGGKLHQRVMPVDSAFKMVFRMGSERFRDAVLWRPPPIIETGLALRALVHDSLATKLLKRFGGLVVGILMRSWRTFYRLAIVAVRIWGSFFFLIFWALLLDYIVKHRQRLVDQYALRQDVPRRTERVSLRRRAPGGVSP